MRILVYRTGRLGDFIVAIPALQLIRKLHPAAHITLLTCASTKRQYAAKTRSYTSSAIPLPWIEFVQPSPVNDVLFFQDLRDWTGLRAVRREIAARHFDDTFVLPFAYEGWANRLKKLAFLRALGVRGRIHGWRGPRMFGPGLHQVEVPLTAVRQGSSATGDTTVPGCDLHISPAARAWAGEQWIKHGLEGRQVIAVFAGGTYAHKRWPAERFAVLCAELAADPATRFIFVGSQSERAWAEPAAQTTPNRHWNACGETNLGQLAALLERCALFIGNDSGPGHLAAALNVPCVTIMSSIYPAGLWEPWGPVNTAVRHVVPCAVCRCETHCPQGTRACIDGITVANVIDAVKNSRRKLEGQPSDFTTPSTPVSS